MLNFSSSFLNAIVNSINNTNPALLRHDNDVEADSKT
jgi:hypothetical protein